MSTSFSAATLDLARNVTTVIESVTSSSGAAAKTTLVDANFPYYIR